MAHGLQRMLQTVRLALQLPDMRNDYQSKVLAGDLGGGQRERKRERASMIRPNTIWKFEEKNGDGRLGWGNLVYRSR